LQKAKRCKQAREQMTNRHFNGVFDHGHKVRMEELENEIRRAERAVARSCEPTCPPAAPPGNTCR
jgi:hypothetical protein